MVNGFAASDTRDLILMVTFTFTMRHHLIQRHLYTSSRLATLSLVRFAVCNAWQRSRMQTLRRIGEKAVLFQSVCGPEFVKFSGDVGSLSCLPMPFSDCLSHVSFRKHSPLYLEVVENRTNVKVFWPQFLWERQPRLLFGNLLGRLTTHYLAKFG